MPNKDKIFKLFDEVENDPKDEEKLVGEFLKSSYAKIGMFVKLIQNHEVFHAKLKKFLMKEQPNYNIESTKEASSFTVFNRAWNYIKNIDIKDQDTIKSIQSFNNELLYNVLEKSILYFESTEEYEKCSFLLKIQKVLKNN